MWVARLRLQDFRSYAEADVALERGVTTILGQNGQGKTNLVEAIGYASVLGSHRVAGDAPLVRVGAQRAVIGVDLRREDRAVVVEVEITPGQSNRARVNRSPVPRARDVLGLLRTVLFAPEDLSLVKGDPSERRRFVDELIVQRTPRMQGVRTDYDRILKQRNALLKSAAAARRGNGDDVARTLEVWDEQLARVGGELAAARVRAIGDIRGPLLEAYALLAGGESSVSSSEASIGYQSALGPDISASTNRDAWFEALMSGIEGRRRDELQRGLTLVGPQRDDVALGLGGMPAKGFASHGESWSIALALRLACLDVLRADGDDPVLVLDDVFAELDAPRRRRLTERVLTCSQVLITAAVSEDVPDELAGRRLHVTRGEVVDG